jgi:hypothetical protein
MNGLITVDSMEIIGSSNVSPFVVATTLTLLFLISLGKDVRVPQET